MIKIIKYNNKYLRHCSELISRTYKEFNYKEGTKGAVEKYISYYNPKITNIKILDKSFKRTPYCYVALDDNRIIGVVRGFEGRLINLFVDKQYHKNGIARKLMNKFELVSLQNGVKTIKTRASIYAIKFYQKIGYKKTTGVRNFIGLKVQPMIKEI